jgi:hypothetical protein
MLIFFLRFKACVIKYYTSDIMRTTIHIDLESIFIQKHDLSKLIFGLYKYAEDKLFTPPYTFTCNVNIQDTGYLGELKNNNVQLVESCCDADIVFDNSWKNLMCQLLVPNRPVPTPPLIKSRACVYVDWDNIQVSQAYIESFFSGVKQFIHNTKAHSSYIIYVFLHTKTPHTIKDTIKQYATPVIIIKDKTGCGDGEIIDYIRRNTVPGDSLCIASGDRDFSSLMVEYVRNKYNVFLVYNKQALFTFKHNQHWLDSIDVKSIDGVDTKQDKPPKTTSPSPSHKTKPCKFYNLSGCTAVGCRFLHLCGVCGQPHKMQDFHQKTTVIKNIICKKYNMGTCTHNRNDCAHLHICAKCKQPHPYIDCKFMVMYCPLCRVHMSSTKQFITHQLDPVHSTRVSKLKIIYPQEINTPTPPVLII